MPVVRSGSARANGPVGLLPGPGWGGGGSSSARAGAKNQGFFSGSCQQANASRPPGFEVCPDIGEGGLRLVEEHHSELAHRQIERCPRDGVGLHVDDREAQVCGTGLTRSPGCQLEQRGGHVCSDHRAVSAHQPSGRDRGPAAAAAHIEHPLARRRRSRVHQVRP